MPFLQLTICLRGLAHFVNYIITLIWHLWPAWNHWGRPWLPPNHWRPL